MSLWNEYMNEHASLPQTKRQQMIERVQQRQTELLRNKNLSYVTVTINGEEREAVITRSDNGDDIKNLLSLPNEKFERGSLVEWQDNYWLIVSHDVQDELYTRAKIQQCNYTLKWINNNGDIIERHCIITNNDRNSSGERETKEITVGDNRLNLIIAKDSETKELYRGQRFLVDDVDAQQNILAYQITKPDRLPGLYNGKGVYTFGLKECNRSTNDNTELMVADYYTLINSSNKDDTDVPTSQPYAIRIEGCNDGVLYIDEDCELSFSIVDKQGDVIQNSNGYEYSLENGEDYVSIKPSADNHTLTLYVPLKYSFIGKRVTLRVMSSLYNLSTEKEFMIKGWS